MISLILVRKIKNPKAESGIILYLGLVLVLVWPSPGFALVVFGKNLMLTRSEPGVDPMLTR